MKKVELDFSMLNTVEQIQDYIQIKFQFPEYYGKNLDALYDMLTDLCEDTRINIHNGQHDDDIWHYLRKVQSVMLDAQEENPHLHVLYKF